MAWMSSRRGFVGIATIAGASAWARMARAQAGLGEMLARKLPRELRPLVAEIPPEWLDLADGIVALEREAERLDLPRSLLTPRNLASIPLDPARFYETALPRLVALVDRGEKGDSRFAERAGGLLARLHSGVRTVPEGFGGTTAPQAGLDPRRPVRFAFVDQQPAVPGVDVRVDHPLPVPVTPAPDDSDEADAGAPAAVALPPVSRSLKFDDIAGEYLAYFKQAELRPIHRESAEFHLAMMRQSRARYATVATRAKVPWYFVATIHGLETSFNFRAHLHNGDFPLGRRTHQVPAGRPLVWLPPSDWDSSALDALRLMGFADQADWSLPRTLYRLEAFNGFGYRRRGLISPYLWSYSNHYTRGKFVADGRFDPAARSRQCGAAVMLRLLADAGEIAV